MEPQRCYRATVKDKVGPFSVAVTLDVTVNKIGEHPTAKAPWAGFDATATIKRTDFGLGLYAPNVSDDVKITISVELKGPAPAKP